MNTANNRQQLESKHEAEFRMIQQLEDATKEAGRELMKKIILPVTQIDCQPNQAAIGQTIRLMALGGKYKDILITKSWTAALTDSSIVTGPVVPSIEPPVGHSKYRFPLNSDLYGNVVLRLLLAMFKEVLKDIEAKGPGMKVIAFRLPLNPIGGDSAIAHFQGYDSRFGIPFDVSLYDMGTRWCLEVGMAWGVSLLEDQPD